ncbi:MAG TPA: 30S ribosome-binding factor RbfA [Syntrophomonadaceae bacterium]|nr:30S ribosome-binding factor RbfA [Syntrophomonadaceae bacterium]
MSKRRQERMAVEIQRILASIIYEMKDPRVDFTRVSITKVEVANDISYARVYVSILADEDKQKETIHALQNAKGFIRSEMAKFLNTRHIPELDIRLDRSIEHGIHISSLLDKIKEAEAKDTNGGENGE